MGQVQQASQRGVAGAQSQTVADETPAPSLKLPKGSGRSPALSKQTPALAPEEKAAAKLNPTLNTTNPAAAENQAVVIVPPKQSTENKLPARAMTQAGQSSSVPAAPPTWVAPQARAQLPPRAEAAPRSVGEERLTFDVRDGSLSPEGRKVASALYREAITEIVRVNPRLAKTLAREDVKIVFTDDAAMRYLEAHDKKAAAQRQMDSTAGGGRVNRQRLDACTLTFLDGDKRSKGSTIYIDRSIFNCAPGEFVKLAATLDHELHHCNQPAHPPKGQRAVPTDGNAMELDAHTECRKDMWLMFHPGEAVRRGLVDQTRVEQLGLKPEDSWWQRLEQGESNEFSRLNGSTLMSLLDPYGTNGGSLLNEKVEEFGRRVGR